MTTHALRSLVVVVKIAPSVKKSAEAPCRPRKLPGVLQSYVLDCYTNSKKFKVEFFMLFFSINEELRSVVNEHFNGKLFSQILDTECVTFINCNKCNFNIRSLILILIRNSMKRQTEKRGRQAFRDEKNIQNSTCCPGKAKCLEYNSA